MKTEQLAKILNAQIVNLADESRQIECGYAGDFLSFVMGKAPTNCCWFTVMNNINVCAVATLADITVVVLCEGVLPDENLLAKIKLQGINLISTKLDIFSAIKLVADKI
ncbi:MAG: hypothetical protein RR338_04980 [Clostridia bacterium]